MKRLIISMTDEMHQTLKTLSVERKTTMTALMIEAAGKMVNKGEKS